MTVYVQYIWNEDSPMTAIETAWVGATSDVSIATESNNFLVSHAWIDGIGFKINTDDIQVTNYKQVFNTIFVYVTYTGAVEEDGTDSE